MSLVYLEEFSQIILSSITICYNVDVPYWSACHCYDIAVSIKAIEMKLKKIRINSDLLCLESAGLVALSQKLKENQGDRWDLVVQSRWS